MRRLWLAFVLVVMAVSVGSAQSKPSFAGTWTQVAPADQAGDEMLVKHDATTLSQEHPSEGGSHLVKYIVDGKEHQAEPLGAGSGHEVTTKYTAAWQGNTVVVEETSDYQSGLHRVARSVWSLDAKGQLVIDFSGNMPDGSQMKIQMIFKKK